MPWQSALSGNTGLRACRVVAAEPVDEQSDHSPRVAIIFGWHAQACDLCAEGRSGDVRSGLN